MAKANAKAKADKINSEGNLEQQKCKAKAERIEFDSYISLIQMDNKKIEDQEREKNKMQLEKMSKMNEIEIKKFRHMVNSIGRDTIIAMAKSGPENKAKLLKSLGLEGYLVTDGKTPINLFNAAEGMVKK